MADLSTNGAVQPPTPDAAVNNTGTDPTGTPPVTPVPVVTPKEAPLTLTQGDLDRLIAKRLADDRKARDDEAQRKAQAEAGNFKALYETAQAEHTAALTAAQERTRAAELKAALLTAAPKVNLLPAAYDDALKLINPTLIEWDADQPTGASIKRALEALVKDRPYLIATNAAPAASPSAFAPQGGAAPANDPTAAQYQQSISGRW